jgi:hypothetical protein
MISTKDKRRKHRIDYLQSIRVSWEERGEPRFVFAKCIEISETGLRIELAYPIRTGASILLREDSIGLATSATVKHMIRRGGKCLLGLQLRQGILARTIAQLECAAGLCLV